MSVLKANRNESKFIVFRNIYKLRRTICDELLFDFGYRRDKAEARIFRKMGVPKASYEELDDAQKKHYDRIRARYDSYDQWFINEMKTEILQNLRDITGEIFMANSIYPTSREELIERRIHQDRAIGHCAQLEQNLFAVIMELPVDHNRYTRLAKDIEYEIHLLKQWRKSDARFKNMVEKGETSYGPVDESGYPSVEESLQNLSGDVFEKSDGSIEKILSSTAESSESKTPQQFIKGMPERVFARNFRGSF